MATDWHRYQLTWRLESPLHIGWRTIGTVARTRLWVPGRNLWGAMIDTIARTQQRATDADPPYKVVTDIIDQAMRFEAAFLSTNQNQRCAPKYGKQGLQFGDMPQRELERRALFASVSTAIEHGPGTADEGQLFEVEAIAPRSLLDKSPEVPFFLVGQLWVRAGDSVGLGGTNTITIEGQPLQDLLEGMRMGGEQAKGFGRLSWQTLKDLHEISPDGDNPTVTLGAGDPFPMLVKHDGTTECRGEIEPIIGRRTTNGNKHGQELIEAQMCWLPGSYCPDHEIKLKLGQGTPGIATIES